MRILYHGTSPGVPTGFGQHTKRLLDRITRDHTVGFLPSGSLTPGDVTYHDIPVHHPAMTLSNIESVRYWQREGNYDVVISHSGHWSNADDWQRLHDDDIPLICYSVVDQQAPGGRLPIKCKQALDGCFMPVYHSEFATELAEDTPPPRDQYRHIPHGVDSDVYDDVTGVVEQPELKEPLGIEPDDTLYTIVGGNNGTRENMPEQMHAFARFVEAEGADDAYLYVHAHPRHGNGHDLYDVRRLLDMPDRILLPDEADMAHGISVGTMVRVYNATDVLLAMSRADSWGLTVTEAMMTGTAVIGANHSAMPEQFDRPPRTPMDRDQPYIATDHGLLVNRGSVEWSQRQRAYRFLPHIEDMQAAITRYYNTPSERAAHADAARRRARTRYDMDHLYETEWQPLIRDAARRVTSE